jgi:hypothetical protein
MNPIKKENIEHNPTARCFPEGRKNRFLYINRRLFNNYSAGTYFLFYKLIRYRMFSVLYYVCQQMGFFFTFLIKKIYPKKGSSARSPGCADDKS